MVDVKEYRMVESIEEAYELNSIKGNVILGGMGWARMQFSNINTAIDISNLGLKGIVEEKDKIVIGAMTTLRELETSEILKKYFGQAPEESVKSILGIQFRNSATIGGSLYMKFGFSDVLTFFLALDTEIQMYKNGILKIDDFLKNPLRGDILMNVFVKKTPMKVRYLHVRKSKTDFPILTVAVAKNNRGYLAVVGARPQRAQRVDDIDGILNGEVDDDKIEKFAQYVVSQMKFSDNVRASGAYRKHIAKVLVRRGITELLSEEL